MRGTRPTRLLIALCFSFAVPRLLMADDPITLVPERIEIGAKGIDDTWKVWGGIGNAEGVLTRRERISAMVADENVLWIGTSWGRLLSHTEDNWTLHGTLKGVQITGIAVDGPDKLWLSTSDGIRRLQRNDDKSWKATTFQTYYEGHPSFVSGAYLPGEDAVRRWAYVDDIYVPVQEKTYSPFVISQEHGLFCWGGYGGVWHHYMPHYTGANSAWLDIRELIPHRRPICMVEDREGHLWVGTEWDGIVRMNAEGRKYARRKPEDNVKDDTEFSFFTSKQIGFDFDRVSDLAVSEEKGVWAVVSSRDSGSRVAHFDGDNWTTLSLGEKVSLSCVAEIRPGEVWVGVGGSRQRRGLSKVNWLSQQVEPVPGLNDRFRDIVTLTDGRVFAASRWALYETNKTEQNVPNSNARN
jgi:ligand-binding sensor domain-containing protein